ncbi:hypothetical protein C1646_699022 [Rhizophagus diaphanus]|nr:hypothetical protein C1646_699022 [Rhizophagus diaphanus] [Rhizophagus sp. MUCL 43196]
MGFSIFFLYWLPCFLVQTVFHFLVGGLLFVYFFLGISILFFSFVSFSRFVKLRLPKQLF